jgi:DNA-binding transcriptional ArsR family regulator
VLTQTPAPRRKSPARPQRVTELSAAFAALSDSTRREVIQVLLASPRRAGELAQWVHLSPPALSRHLRVLRKAGLVVEQGIEADARVRLYRVEPTALAPIRDWVSRIEQMWEEQLLAFKEHVERSSRDRGLKR